MARCCRLEKPLATTNDGAGAWAREMAPSGGGGPAAAERATLLLLTAIRLRVPLHIFSGSCARDNRSGACAAWTGCRINKGMGGGGRTRLATISISLGEQ